MKRFNITMFNIYGAVIHDESIVAPDGFIAVKSAMETYYNLFPNISRKMLAKGVTKFICEVQK